MGWSGCREVRSALGASAVLLVGLLASGCGTSTVAATDDDAFPDDRVLTVRVALDAADWESLQTAATDKEFYRADISIDGEEIPDVAVRAKGSSSLMGATMSPDLRIGLKVDVNFFNAGRSYHGVKKLVYNNGYGDPTLMKEFLSYEIMAEMGLPTPRACFVDLWVNDTHMGVYTQAEAIDASFAMKHFGTVMENLYKPEITAGRLDWTEKDALAQAARASATTTTSTTEPFRLGGGSLEDIIERLGDEVGWIPGRQETTTTKAPADGRPAFMRLMQYSPDYLVSMQLRTNEEKPDYSRLYDLLEALNREPGEVSTDDLERVLNVDEILRFLAVSVTLVHLDNYIGMGHNYYLYEDGGRFLIIPWDLNMTFGGFSSAVSDDQLLNFYIDEPTAAPVDQYPLVEQLLDEPEYLETYHAYLRELIEGPFSVDHMTARINEIAALIRPYVQNDPKLFFSADYFEQGLTSNLDSGAARMQSGGGKFIGLTYFVEQRTASIAAQLSGERPAGSGDGSGNGGGAGLAAFGVGRK
jgi:spore coat protein CotH